MVREGDKASGQEKRLKDIGQMEKKVRNKDTILKLLVQRRSPSDSNKLNCCYRITLGYRSKLSY